MTCSGEETIQTLNDMQQRLGNEMSEHNLDKNVSIFLI